MAGEVQAVAKLSSGDGPLSVRIRPSSLKRDCDRRATNTGEKCLVNVHAKSRLTPELLAATLSAHGSAAFGVHLLAGFGGDDARLAAGVQAVLLPG
jgi:hypothetical protein